MAKNKVSDWSSTASTNTDVGGINIAEGMLPSDVNNAMREMMAQVKDMQTGVDGDNFVVGGALSVTGASTLNTITGNSLSILSSGTLAIDGVGTLSSTATDAVKVPAGSTAQRPTPYVGHIRYNSTLGSFEGYNGTQWGNIGGGATGGGSDTVFIQNSKTVTTNYTIPSTQNAMCTGTITINSGVTVTVPTGSRWVIL
jgi:hypothetical protein